MPLKKESKPKKSSSINIEVVICTTRKLTISSLFFEDNQIIYLFFK